jgi:hypothetical protein
MKVLLEKHKTIEATFFTTKTISREGTLIGRPLDIRPSAFHCYLVGRNITARLDQAVAHVAAKAA